MKSLLKIVTFLFLVVLSLVSVSYGPANQASQHTLTIPPSAAASQMNVSIFTDQNGLFGFSPNPTLLVSLEQISLKPASKLIDLAVTAKKWLLSEGL